MELRIRTGNNWRRVVSFQVGEIEFAKAAGIRLAFLSSGAGEPAEMSIVDGDGVAVLAAILPRGWVVPKSAEGYAWVP